MPMLFVVHTLRKIFIPATAKKLIAMVAKNAEKNAFIVNALFLSTPNVKLLKNVQEINAQEKDHLTMKLLKKEDRKING